MPDSITLQYNLCPVVDTDKVKKDRRRKSGAGLSWVEATCPYSVGGSHYAVGALTLTSFTFA